MLVAFGDSNATGFSIDPEKSWMVLAAQALGTTWITLGVAASALEEVAGGPYGSGHSRRWLLWQAVRQHPGSYTIIYSGTADAVLASGNPAYTTAGYKAQLQEVLSGLSSTRTRVVLPNSVTSLPQLSAAYQQATIDVVSDLGITWIDTRDFVPHDSIHLGVEAQRELATRIVNSID